MNCQFFQPIKKEERPPHATNHAMGIESPWCRSFLWDGIAFSQVCISLHGGVKTVIVERGKETKELASDEFFRRLGFD